MHRPVRMITQVEESEMAVLGSKICNASLLAALYFHE